MALLMPMSAMAWDNTQWQMQQNIYQQQMLHEMQNMRWEQERENMRRRQERNQQNNEILRIIANPQQQQIFYPLQPIRPFGR